MIDYGSEQVMPSSASVETASIVEGVACYDPNTVSVPIGNRDEGSLRIHRPRPVECGVTTNNSGLQ